MPSLPSPSPCSPPSRDSSSSRFLGLTLAPKDLILVARSHVAQSAQEALELYALGQRLLRNSQDIGTRNFVTAFILEVQEKLTQAQVEFTAAIRDEYATHLQAAFQRLVVLRAARAR